MASCPSCLEELKPALLGRRRLAGDCEICGERVCDACLRVPTLRAEAFRARSVRPGEVGRMVKGVACTSCLWGLLDGRGITPPFPEPAGHRVRAAQASCEHPRQVRWMRCCPDCGAEEDGAADPGAPSCDACGAPSHALFNACWSCGESFEEENDFTLAPATLGLDQACGPRGCGGPVGWPMPYCPWCAGALAWPHTRPAVGVTCLRCDAALDPTWVHCIACGAEAPPPERCIECGEGLEKAECAARCDECRHLVCGECFGSYRLAEDEDGENARLLCVSCAEALGAVADVEDRDEADRCAAAAEGEDAEDGDDEDDADEDDSDEDDADEDDGDEDDGDEDGGDEDDGDGDGDGDERNEAADGDAFGSAFDAEADAAHAEAAAEEARAQARSTKGENARSRAPVPRGEEPSAWEILGVARGAPLAEIRSAYLKLVAQYHPDKVAQLGPKLQALALEETRRLNQAWSELRERRGGDAG